MDPRIGSRLAKSGITDRAYLSELGWSVVPSATVKTLCPHQTISEEDVIKITFPEVTAPDGSEYARYRQLGSTGPKYLSPAGSQFKIYTPIHFGQNAAQKTLFICEGEIKAAMLDHLGYRALGITGVSNWFAAGARAEEVRDAYNSLEDSRLSEETEPHAVILREALESEQVIVVGDSDLAFNPAAARSLGMLVASLRKHIGLKVTEAAAVYDYRPLAKARNILVSLVILPPTFAPAPEADEKTPVHKLHPKVGIDDYFLTFLADITERSDKPYQPNWMTDPQYEVKLTEHNVELRHKAGIEMMRRVHALASAALGSTETALAQQLSARVERHLAVLSPAGIWLAYDEHTGFWRMLDKNAELKYPPMLAGPLKDYASILSGILADAKATIPVEESENKSGKPKYPEHITKWLKEFESTQKAVRASINALETTRDMTAILKQASAMLGIRDLLWDQHPTLFSAANCVIDLKTGETKPHDAALLLRGGSPVVHDPTALCPNFDTYIAQVHPDEATRKYLQTMLGYFMTGLTVEQILVINSGDGRNGKGALNRVLNLILGGSYMTAAAKDLLAEKKPGAIPNDLADLSAARLVTISEIDDQYRWSPGTVKLYTGGDAVKARYLHKEFFTFKPKFKMMLDVNGMLSIGESSDAMEARIINIPWTQRFLGDAVDKTLDDKLATELRGVFNWLLQGARTYFATGLPYRDRPALVKEATNKLFAFMDEMQSWLDECCVMDLSVKTPFSALFQSHSEWRKTNGHQPIGKKTFTKKLAAKKIDTVRGSKGITCISGVRLRDSRDVRTSTSQIEVKEPSVQNLPVASTLPTKYEVM
jgi:P4 family phage/plasmid primase-like protien